jgi:hypothetical protein
MINPSIRVKVAEVQKSNRMLGKRQIEKTHRAVGANFWKISHSILFMILSRKFCDILRISKKTEILVRLLGFQILKIGGEHPI